MEIVEDEQQWSMGGSSFDEGRDRLEEREPIAIRRGALRIARERPEHTRSFAGCLLRWLSLPPCQTVDDLEPRMERRRTASFPATGDVYAEPEVVCVVADCTKKARLADAGMAGNEDQPPLTGPSVGELPSQDRVLPRAAVKSLETRFSCIRRVHRRCCSD